VGRPALAAGLRARRLTLAALLLAVAPAHAGHDDVKVDPALRRNPGKVTALGAQADSYSFEAKPLRAPAFVPNELRGWRLTVLAGKRFAAAFQVQSNTESHITVAPANGPLDGLAVGDLFIVEEIAPEKAQ
jgi:hypothetical protein